jgi:GT2 family glycosyltransferase
MSPTSPRLSILIVSYNTRDMTLACIESVRREAIDHSYEIIVVDNNSPDGSAEAIAARFPDVSLIASKENLGFARANNVAAERATGDYILLLNPDTVILDHAVDKLMSFAHEYPQAKIWGGRTIFADGTLNATCCYQYTTPWSLFCRAVGLSALIPNSVFFNPENFGGWKRDTVRRVDIVTGCFLLIEAKLWRALDGFDRKFFMFSEEVDLALRAEKMGAAPMFTPDATIIHHGGGAAPASARRVILIMTSMVSLMEIHWTTIDRAAGRVLLWITALARLVGFRLAQKFTGSSRHGEKADMWREIWSARRDWQRGYKDVA